jgi:hypothetical protein
MYLPNSSAEGLGRAWFAVSGNNLEAESAKSGLVTKSRGRSHVIIGHPFSRTAHASRSLALTGRTTLCEGKLAGRAAKPSNLLLFDRLWIFESRDWKRKIWDGKCVRGSEIWEVVVFSVSLLQCRHPFPGNHPFRLPERHSRGYAAGHGIDDRSYAG